jgi:hypothetical protein
LQQPQVGKSQGCFAARVKWPCGIMADAIHSVPTFGLHGHF